MKRCENCGAELQKGMRFCGNCGGPVSSEEGIETNDPGTDSNQKIFVAQTEKVEPMEEKSKAEELKSENPAVDSPRMGTVKKVVIAFSVLIMALAVIAFVTWQTKDSGKAEEPVMDETVQTIDQDNLRGTLDWKEDQDKEYALKNSLIEGNSDSNVKEIFEESAYFTPTNYAYASNENVTYYSIECEYKKEDKEIPYVLVFQVNQDEHLELAELYKNEKKVDREKFDGFYEKLYTAEEDLKAAEEARAAATKEANPLTYMKGLTYTFNPDEGDGIPEDVYIENVEEDSIVLTMESGISTMEHLRFYRNGPVGGTEYECHQYGKVINLYVYDENSIGVNFAEADGTDYGLTVYVRQ